MVSHTIFLRLATIICGCLSLYFGRKSSGLSIKPPVDILTPRPGGNGEYGIRQVSSQEIMNSLPEFFKRLGIVSRGKMDIYEMLTLLDTVANVMPGKQPHRHEMMAFADFVDGNIDCISVMFVTKVECPWEADVLLIVQSPILTPEKSFQMLDFIDEMCLNNAILPNYANLVKWDQISNQLSQYYLNAKRRPHDLMLPMRRKSLSLSLESLDYSLQNKARSIFVDSYSIHLGTYWYKLMISHPMDRTVVTPVYIRQKRECPDEYEILFTKPTTGVGSGRGTVGGALVLTTAAAMKIVPTATEEYLLALSREIGNRLKHPDIQPTTSDVIFSD